MFHYARVKGIYNYLPRSCVSVFILRYIVQRLLNLNLPIFIKNDFRKYILTLLWWRKGGGIEWRLLSHEMQRGIFHVIVLLCNALVEKSTHFTSTHCEHPTQICSSVLCKLRKVYILYKSELCITVQEFTLYTLACSSVPRLILYALNPFSRGRECQQFVPYIY